MNLAGLHDRWIAVSVHTRTATAAMRVLRSEGYQVILPATPACARCHHNCRGKPLFPGYLFCRFDATNRWRIVETPGVRGIVSFAGSVPTLFDIEIRNLAILAETDHCRQVVHAIRNGSMVSVAKGPLAGMRGAHIRSGGRGRIIISVSLMQRCIAVELADEDVVLVS